jgi:TolB-like protein
VLLAFGDYVLDGERRELRRGGEPIALEPQVFDLLLYLVQNRDRVASKDDLLQAVWGGRLVSDSALAARLNAARRAIGDDGEAQRWIRTLPRKGVRFIGEVTEAPAALDATSSIKVRKQAAVFPERPSIAVLPFANPGGEREQECFAAGLAEELITTLSRLRWLDVVVRDAALFQQGGRADIEQASAEPGIRYLLAGAVRSDSGRMRITVRLVESETSRQVWAVRYDRPLAAGFAVQDEITDAILAALEQEIGAAEGERARRSPPGRLGAWELYQRGMWHLSRRNREDFTAAHALFGEAFALDPAFAAAHAGFAVSSFWQITHGFTADAEKSRAELLDAASRAVALDPCDALAHSALGLAFMECAEHPNAVAEHEIATALNPTSAFAQWCFGYALRRADRNDEALPRFNLALRLNPRGPMAWSYSTLRASALYHLKRYEEAAFAAGEAMRTRLDDVVWPLVHRAAALGRLNRKREAEPVITDLLRRRPGLTVSGFAAWPYNQSLSACTLEHTAVGLQKAGLPL